MYWNYGDYPMGNGPYPCNDNRIYCLVNTFSLVSRSEKEVSLTVFPSMDFTDEEFCVESDDS